MSSSDRRQLSHNRKIQSSTAGVRPLSFWLDVRNDPTFMLSPKGKYEECETKESPSHHLVVLWWLNNFRNLVDLSFLITFICYGPFLTLLLWSYSPPYYFQCKNIKIWGEEITQMTLTMGMSKPVGVEIDQELSYWMNENHVRQPGWWN